MKNYRLTTRLEDMDLAKVHAFISQSYWANNVPFDTQKRALENSLCIAVLKENGALVGFARFVTDQATFAYLADVFVDESERGQGLSRWMLEEALQLPELQGLRRIMLATKDAHGLYEKLGFTPLNDASLMMEIWTPDVYQTS